MGSIGEVVTTIQKIIAASQKQAASVREISSAIGMMDEMTQHNAALVEESAASTQAFSLEADRLNEQTAAFKLTDDTWSGKMKEDVNEPAALLG